jgi:hypothetical protein
MITRAAPAVARAGAIFARPLPPTGSDRAMISRRRWADDAAISGAGGPEVFGRCALSGLNDQAASADA